MKVETISYEADGLAMESLLYLDEDNAGPRPGVLVFPEAFGLGENAKTHAERLAELGYAVLACDLHGEAKLYDDLATVMGLLEPMQKDPLRTRARAEGGLKALRARAEVDSGRIGAIGFCFGGTVALELARSGADVRGVVGFHSGLATARPQDAKNIKGKVLVCLGADDPGIPSEQRADFEREMREGGVDWRMHLYGGVVHSFTNKNAARLGRPEVARYDAGAHRRSWTEMRAFFDEVFA